MTAETFERSRYDTVRYASLAGRSVLVTGGASGLGEAMVEAFAAQGARVAFLDIDAAAGAIVAGRTGAAFHACDVTDIDALRRTIAVVEAQQDGIGVLINNAGKDDRQPLDEIGPEDWRRLMGLNLDHQFFATQAVAPGMAARGG